MAGKRTTERKSRPSDGDEWDVGVVRHPSDHALPEKEWLSQKLCDFVFSLKDETHIALESKSVEYRRSQNPVLAIESFLLAHQASIYPPLWVLNFLGEAFKKWHDDQGTKPIDKYLKLSPKKFKALLADQRDEMVMLDVARLIALGLSARQAACFSAKRLATKDWNKTAYKKLGAIDAATVLDRWKKRWSKTFDKKFINRYFNKTNDSGCTDYLKLFPGALKQLTENRAAQKTVVRKRQNRTP